MPYKKYKIRGKDLYKVINTETKEVKSNGSTLEDAKKQIRLLNSLEKKEKKGGALKASQIKTAIDLSYQGKNKSDAPKGYEIDKELSDGRVKVYKDVNSPQTLVVHRGSSGLRDWLDNVRYGLSGEMKTTETFKKHSKKHQRALDKYGAENVIAIGHSRAGKYVEELNKDKPVKEVITYNKASGPSDLFRKNPKNQTDIRTDVDLVSALAPLQSHENKVVTIPSTSWNPLTAHSTEPLAKLGEKLLGKGFIGGAFNPKKVKVSEMRKFIKAFKKQNGQKWSGSKIGKKELVKILEDEILNNENIDELIGGSIWTDFVKQFSSRHSLKYACSLSKYKEPLRTAYKKFKEGKDWYEPLNLPSNIIGLEEPEEELTFPTPKIKRKPESKPKPEPEEPEEEKMPDLPLLDSERQKKINGMKVVELKQILKDKGFTKFGKMKWNDLINKILELENIPPGRKYEKNVDYCNHILKKSHMCYTKNPNGMRSDIEIATNYLKNADAKTAEIRKLPEGEEKRRLINNHRSLIERYKDIIKNCKLTLDELNKCEEQNKMSGGAKIYKPNFLPPLITKYETQLKKMTKAELQSEADNNDVEYSNDYTKQQLIELLMNNAGQEFGSRYHYATDYPNCETTIRKAHQCYGVNSEIKKEFKGIQESKKDYSKISEKIKQVQRRPIAINNKKMMREDKKELDNLISLRENIIKNVKKKQDKIRELDYICQGVINELIKCEKYRVDKNPDDIIEDPVDWEERTRIRKVENEDMTGGNKWIDFVKMFADKYDTTYGCSLSDYRTKNAYKLFKEGKDWYIPRPTKVKFKDDDEINLIDVDMEDIKDRNKYNKCINLRKKLKKLSNNELKQKIIELNPNAENVKGTNKELIDEILYLNKCDDLIDENFKSLFELEEEEEEWSFPTPKIKQKDFNVEKNVENILKKIEKLKQIGEEKGPVHYKGYTIIADLAYMNVISKYGGQCVIVDPDNMEVGIKINTTSDINQTKINNIGTMLKKCVDRGLEIIVIPLDLLFGANLSSHANLLVYRPFQRIVERFEPHGQQYGNSEKYDNIFNNKLRQLFEEDLRPILGDIRYKKPSDICPNKRGFQSLENEIKDLKQEGGGFCTMWSLFLMEMIFLNPEKTTKEIIEEVFNITKSQPAYLKSLIRGYVIEIENGLNELSKYLKFNDPFKFQDNPKKLISNLTSSREQLYNWVLNIIFESEKNIKEVPDYLPLPPKEEIHESPEDKIIKEYIKKINKLNKNEFNNMTRYVYGFTYSKKKLKYDMISKYVKGLFENKLEKYGSIGLKDIDIILDEKLYKLENILPKDYLKNKMKKNEQETGGSKLSSKMSQGFAKVAEKLNPFAPALKNKKTRNLMTSSGDVTRDYILPAVVEVGKPIAEASAMGLSTMATGNPMLGKIVFDSLYRNMVTEKGYDPRQNQKSKILGKVAKATGAVGEAYVGKSF